MPVQKHNLNHTPASAGTLYTDVSYCANVALWKLIQGCVSIKKKTKLNIVDLGYPDIFQVFVNNISLQRSRAFLYACSYMKLCERLHQRVWNATFESAI